MKTSTWNVRSLYPKGKLENAKLEMARLASLACARYDGQEQDVSKLMITWCTTQVALLMEEVLLSF